MKPKKVKYVVAKEADFRLGNQTSKISQLVS